jgi:WD40 repeat protein/nucleoside phosphorylase
MSAATLSILSPAQVSALLEVAADRKVLKPKDLQRVRLLVEFLDATQWRAFVAEVEPRLFPGATPDNAATGFRNLKSQFNAAMAKAVADGRLHAEQRLWLEVSQKRAGEVQRVWFTGRPPVLAAARLGDLDAAERAGWLYDNIAVRPPGAEPILLLTVNEHETNAVLDVFAAGAPLWRFQREGFSYDYLGEVEGDDGYTRPVVAFRCQMGSLRSGAASSRVPVAIRHLHPHAVLAVGIAFGDRDRQQLADVLIADQVQTYESERYNKDGSHHFRGERVPASARWLDRCLQVPLPRIVRRKGLMVCGEMLIDNAEYRAMLAREFPRSIGGDMESFGMATACDAGKVEWAVIKAVSDWGDGSKNAGGDAAKDAHQRRAALNAAIVAYSAVYLRAPRLADISAARRAREQADAGLVPAARTRDHDLLSHDVDNRGVPQSLRDPLQPSTRQAARAEAAAEGVGAESVHQSLLRWLERADAPPVFALLGEYGMGKTISCQRLTKALNAARQSGQAPAWMRRPVYFDLRELSLFKGRPKGDVTPLPTAEALVDDLFAFGWSVPAGQARPTHADLQAWLAEGALLILDGLDECLVHLDDTQHGQFVQMLLHLVVDHLPVESAEPAASEIEPRLEAQRLTPRLLVSCRTNFFKTLSDQRNLFTGYRRGRVDADWYDSRVLVPLSEEQIARYLRAVLPDLPTDQVLALIDDIHNLRELAERPMTLKLLGEYIPELEEARKRGEVVNGAYLYGLVANKWLQRDAGKHHLQPEHKLRLMPALAAHLWRSGVRSLPYAELHTWFHQWRETQPDLARRYGPEAYSQVKLEEDLRTASFIVREDGEGGAAEEADAGADVGTDVEQGFRFAHSSMQEYFLAVFLAQAVVSDRFEDWAMPIPSEETLDFLGQRLQLDEAALPPARRKAGGLAATFNQWRRQYRAQASELLLRHALRARGADTQRLTSASGAPAAVVPLLPGFDLRGAQLRGWRFGTRLPAADAPPLDLGAVCWAGADLRDAAFAHVRLGEGDFSGARLHGASFQHCDLRRCRGEGAALIGTVFRHCRLEGSHWATTEAWRLQAVDCSGDHAPDMAATATLPAHFSPPPVNVARGGLRPQGAGLRANIASPSETALALLDCHSNPINHLAVASDGRTALSASWDNTVRLWDLASGECLRVFRGHAGWVNSTAFAPDGRTALSAADDLTLRQWDLGSGECLRVFRGHSSFVSSAVFAPDGRTALSAAYDHTLRLWDLASGTCLCVFEGHTGWVNSAAFAPDGRTVLSAADDHTLRLWDIASGECLRVFQGHSSNVNSAAFAPDGRSALSASRDHTLRYWDLASGECIRVFAGHSDFVNSAAFAPDGCTALSAADDRTLRLWDVASGECLRVLRGHASRVSSAAFTPDGHTALSAAYDYKLGLWDLASGECLRVFQGHSGRVTSAAFAPDGRSALCTSWDHTLRLWDIASGECLRVFHGHSSLVSSAAFAPDGRTALSASWDSTFRLWDIASGECLRVFQGHSGPVNSAAFAHDGRSALCAANDNTLTLWDLASGECLRVFQGHTGWVNSAAFSPDGRTVLSAAEDRTIRLWDISSGECIRVFEGHSNFVNSAAFAPDGCTVLSAAYDNTLRLWDLASGKCLRVFHGHASSVTSAVFARDGRIALSACRDNTIRLWDIASGECLRIFQGHTGWVTSAAFAPDGRHLLSASQDGSLRLWSLDAPPEEACRWIAAMGSPNGVPSHASWRPAHALSAEERAAGACDQLLDASGDAWRFVAWLAKGHPSDPDGWTRLPLQGYEA